MNKKTQSPKEYPQKSVLTNDDVISLSDQTLTRAELSLLNKGLKFCPTSRNTTLAPVTRETEVLFRKMRFRSFVEKKQPNNKTSNKKLDNPFTCLKKLEEKTLRKPLLAHQT